MCAQVDIYSMGIIMWELVTVQAPSRGNLRCLQVPGECPMDIARLIQDCLEANHPSARPSATDIYDRIMARCAANSLLSELQPRPFLCRHACILDEASPCIGSMPALHPQHAAAQSCQQCLVHALPAHGCATKGY